MPTETYYHILGIKPSATQDDIKKAYRKLAKKHHPDVSKARDAETRFKKIVEAYDVLKNKNKRKQYDLLGKELKQNTPDTHFQGVDLNLFADLFNQQNVFAQKSKPINQNLLLHVDLEDIAHGTNKDIKLEAHKSVNIKVPKGIEEGQVIRLAQQAPGGGDLLVKIAINPHSQFSYQGKNLFTEINVSLDENRPPSTLKIPTLNQPIQIKCPEKLQTLTETQQRLRLKGLGLPGKPSGDLFVTIKLNTASTAEKLKYREDIKSLIQDVNKLNKTLAEKTETPPKAKHRSLDFLLQELSQKIDTLITEAFNEQQYDVIKDLQKQLIQAQKLLD
jgi:curved DNA-binding protein